MWSTNGGHFYKKCEVLLNFKIPQFTTSKDITWRVAVDDTPGDRRYNMIIGKDLLQALKMDILWSTGQLKWEDITITMRLANSHANSKHYRFYDEALNAIAHADSECIE